MKGQIKPSKPVSSFNVIVGIIFIGIGFVVIVPNFGAFGILWIFLAIGITGFHALNAFSSDGVAHEVVEFDSTTPSSQNPPSELSCEQRLLQLDQLKAKKLLSEVEYHEQRSRILEDL